MFAFGWVMLGAALQGLGRLQEALEAAQRGAQLDPNNAEALLSFGGILLRSAQYQAAEAVLAKALHLMPQNLAVRYQLALAMSQQLKWSLAIQELQRILKVQPEHFDAHCALGDIYVATNQHALAVAHYERALVQKPKHRLLLERLGDICRNHGQPKEGAQRFQQALDLESTSIVALYGLGLCCIDLAEYQKATAKFEKVLEIQPQHAEAMARLAYTRDLLGEVECARTWFEQAIRYPGTAGAQVFSSYLYFLAHRAITTPAEYLQIARHYNMRVASNPQITARNGQPRIGRRLKVGYVSGDFRQHPICYFYNQLIAEHDRTRTEIYSYMACGAFDEESERVRKSSDHWRVIAGMSGEAAVAAVHQDGIDVLIDLSGHTAYARLDLFALRAAPVQAHYLGFFASTGLEQMDYWIADPVLVPESMDHHFAERVCRLPRTWVSYRGLDSAPLEAWSKRENTQLTLGSFNNLPKLNGATLELWAAVMRALPQARILLKTKGLEESANRDRIWGALQAYGVAPERVHLVGNTPDWASHMRLYDELDIALDPVGGVGGGTTTCDALWMGVPVITLAGDRMAQRMTASMLNALGHDEWIAEDREDYIRKVVLLAQDRALRARLRPLQREKMRRCALCDAKGLAKALEDAYEAMFDAWWSSDALSATHPLRQSMEPE